MILTSSNSACNSVIFSFAVSSSAVSSSIEAMFTKNNDKGYKAFRYLWSKLVGRLQYYLLASDLLFLERFWSLFVKRTTVAHEQKMAPKAITVDKFECDDTNV